MKIWQGTSDFPWSAFRLGDQGSRRTVTFSARCLARKERKLRSQAAVDSDFNLKQVPQEGFSRFFPCFFPLFFPGALSWLVSVGGKKAWGHFGGSQEKTIGGRAFKSEASKPLLLQLPAISGSRGFSFGFSGLHSQSNSSCGGVNPCDAGNFFFLLYKYIYIYEFILLILLIIIKKATRGVAFIGKVPIANVCLGEPGRLI